MTPLIRALQFTQGQFPVERDLGEKKVYQHMHVQHIYINLSLHN